VWDLYKLRDYLEDVATAVSHLADAFDEMAATSKHWPWLIGSYPMFRNMSSQDDLKVASEGMNKLSNKMRDDARA